MTDTYQAVIHNNKDYLYECPCGKRTRFTNWIKKHDMEVEIKAVSDFILYLMKQDGWKYMSGQNHRCVFQSRIDYEKKLERRFKRQQNEIKMQK